MSPERLKKVEEIFHAVLEIPLAERESFLRKTCGSDIELRREIESLLSHDDKFDSLIDSAPKSLVVEIFGSENGSDFKGKQINQYRIDKKVGEGGMGVVYLASDTKLGRKVALKVLSDEFARDITRRNRFFQEAKSASALNHPNILTVHEIGEFEGTHYIVTEFIDGRTLSKFLAEEKPGLQTVLDLAAQVTSALAAAHEAGIIHRDIKPENIMVRSDRIVKVLDFGIAKLIDTHRSPVVSEEGETELKPATLPGMIIGTPQYMSPEQARGLRIDLRSDIFSFGVLLYEMIAGRPPFSGATRMDIIGSILKDEPKPLGELLPGLAPELEHLVAKALRKDREQRYQHIKDLAIDLKDVSKSLEFDTKLLFQHTENARAATTVNTTSSIVMQRRFSLIHAFVFLLFAGVVGGSVWWFWPRSTGGAEPLNSVDVVSWTSKPGEVHSVGSFSPDGKMVAFASTRSGAKNIWIKQASSGEAIQITKDEFRNEDPVFSPNGDELAYFSTRGNNGGFWRIPVLGGAPKLIAEVEDGSSELRGWSKSDRLYFESKSELYAIEAATGQIRAVTDFRERQLDARSISISPDENLVAYVTVDGDEFSVWTQKTNGGAPQKLVTGKAEIRNTLWHPDNRRIFYNAAVEGVFQVFVVDAGGGPPRQISVAERDSNVLAVASDGSRILYGSAKEEADIWAVNLRDNREFTVATDIDAELWASVSSDGKSIAYQSIRNLSQGNKILAGSVVTRPFDSDGSPREISPAGGMPHWSPDGKSLAYLRPAANKLGIEIAPFDGSQKRLVAAEVNYPSYTLLPYNPIQDKHFDWSPDSSRLSYISARDGAENLYFVGRDGSNETRVTENRDTLLYLSCPLWSPDGKQIAYTSKTGNSAAEGRPSYQTWLVDVETRKSSAVTRPGRFLRLLGWGANGQELLLATTGGSEMIGLQPEVTVEALNVKTGATRPLLVLKDTYLFNIHLSPNRKTIAFAAHREDRDNLWIIPADGGVERKLTANNDSRLYYSSLAWSPASDAIFFGKQSRYSLISILTNFK